MMNQEELARYHETTDTGDDMDGGEWVNEPAKDPMVTTSLRLPVELMSTIRSLAAAQQVKPTALMRRWVEQAAAGTASNDRPGSSSTQSCGP